MPLLAWIINRAANAQLVDTIVVATPDSEENAPIWQFLDKAPVRLVRGDEQDVLSRVLKAAHETRTDLIVELTGDCPLIDPEIIDACVGYYICGNGGQRTYEAWHFVGNCKPRTWPRGMDVRVFSTKTLERCDSEVRGDAREAYWREHVSPWIYERTDSQYSCLNIAADDQLTHPELNLSVDTWDDYRRVKGVIDDLGAGNPLFTCKDILENLAALPGYETLTMPQLEKDASWLHDLRSIA